jgi:hypothetical protein
MRLFEVGRSYPPVLWVSGTAWRENNLFGDDTEASLGFQCFTTDPVGESTW